MGNWEATEPLKYDALIQWSDEDQAFIAYAPDLPGCAADGPTDLDALRNLRVVIQEWIDTARMLGRPIPHPKVHAR
jgi:predicted RNase H-like HicB family nuclease